MGFRRENWRRGRDGDGGAAESDRFLSLCNKAICPQRSARRARGARRSRPRRASAARPRPIRFIMTNPVTCLQDAGTLPQMFSPVHPYIPTQEDTALCSPGAAMGLNLRSSPKEADPDPQVLLEIRLKVRLGRSAPDAAAPRRARRAPGGGANGACASARCSPRLRARARALARPARRAGPPVVRPLRACARAAADSSRAVRARRSAIKGPTRRVRSAAKQRQRAAEP